MSAYKYIKASWKLAADSPEQRQRLIQWRTEPSTVRIERPTRLDKARALGYKPIQGVILVRQSIPRGSHERPHDEGGRRSKTQRRLLVLRKNYQQLAEERAVRKYPNCEVLNSYWVGEDGKQKWFEIIIVDPVHPRVLADKNLSWLSEPKHTGRAFRGLTSAGRKSRGLRHKGKGSEKARPSHRAHKRNL